MCPLLFLKEILNSCAALEIDAPRAVNAPEYSLEE